MSLLWGWGDGVPVPQSPPAPARWTVTHGLLQVLPWPGSRRLSRRGAIGHGPGCLHSTWGLTWPAANSTCLSHVYRPRAFAGPGWGALLAPKLASRPLGPLFPLCPPLNWTQPGARDRHSGPRPDLGERDSPGPSRPTPQCSLSTPRAGAQGHRTRPTRWQIRGSGHPCTPRGAASAVGVVLGAGAGFHPHSPFPAGGRFLRRPCVPGRRPQRTGTCLEGLTSDPTCCGPLHLLPQSGPPPPSAPCLTPCGPDPVHEGPTPEAGEVLGDMWPGGPARVDMPEASSGVACGCWSGSSVVHGPAVLPGAFGHGEWGSLKPPLPHGLTGWRDLVC